MALKLFKKPQILNEFVKICEKNEYFSANINRNVIKDIKFLKHTPNLEANIERQWFGQSQNIENNLKTFSNVDFKDYGNNLTLLEKNSVVWKRDRLSRSTPFGLIETVNQKQEPPVETDLDEKTIDLHFDGNVKYWICSYLLNEKQSQEYFYRIQRLRKIWWMKVIYWDTSINKIMKYVQMKRFLVPLVVRSESRSVYDIKNKTQ